MVGVARCIVPEFPQRSILSVRLLSGRLGVPGSDFQTGDKKPGRCPAWLWCS